MAAGPCTGFLSTGSSLCITSRHITHAGAPTQYEGPADAAARLLKEGLVDASVYCCGKGPAETNC